MGCGRIGSTLADDPLLSGDVFTHAEAYVRSSGTSLVALCDTDRERVRACGERWGVEALFTDAREMMAVAAPEIVSVCTPTSTHLRTVSDLLSDSLAPRVVLCEKPLAPTLADAQQMAKLAEARGAILATVYMRRYARNMNALKQFMDSGALGAVQGVSGWYIGGTFHNGTHWFDMLRQLIGEVEWVRALDVLREGGADPSLDVLLGMKDGSMATLRACDATRYTLFEMDIVLEKGRAQITDSGHAISVSRAGPSPRYSGYVELQPLEMDFGDRRNLMLLAVEDAVKAVTLGQPPACTAGDGIAALRIADAASRSSGDCIHL